MKRLLLFIGISVMFFSGFSQQVDSITDFRNHQKYKVVKLGNQWWMAENLNAAKYLNGDVIPNVKDNTAWAGLSTGARSYYNNDSVQYASKYGALYNYYTLVDSRKICPSGWHVPNDSEWITLENFLMTNGFNYDGSTTGNKIAKAMASDNGWPLVSGVGSVGNTDYPTYRNKSKFSALPSGTRNNSGTYSGITINSNWWNTSINWTNNVRYFYLSDAYISKNIGNYNYGFSVRCVKDNSSFGNLNILGNDFVAVNDIIFNDVNSSKNLILVYQGTSPLTITNVSKLLPEFSVSLTPETIQPGDTIHFSVSFNTSQKGIYQDTLTIESNDAYNPIIKIPLFSIYTTKLCGVIPVDSVLTKAGSPYFITPTNSNCKNLAIDAGVTLTIEPGVIVFMDSLVSLNIDGKLIANGTAEEPIHFINEGNDYFNRIYFRNAKASSLQHVIIEGGVTGIYAENTNLDLQNTTIKNCTTGANLNTCILQIDSCTISHNTGVGIIGTGSTGNISRSAFSNNGSYGISGGSYKINNNTFNENRSWAIYNTTCTIDSNTITGNVGGIYTSDYSKTYVTNNVISYNTGNGIEVGGLVVSKNTVTNNTGWGIKLNINGYGNASDRFDASKNIVSNNTLGGITGKKLNIFENLVFNNKIVGIEVSYSTIKNNQIIQNIGNGVNSLLQDSLINNIISKNTVNGIKEASNSIIQQNFITSNGVNGIETSALPKVNFNNIYGNAVYDFIATKQGSDTINAWHNYWGTTNPATIHEHIYDYYDDGVTVKVRFGGYITSEIPPSSIQNFTATTLSGGRVELSWKMQANAYQYILYSDNQTGRLDSSNVWLTLDSATTSYTATLPDGDYILGIRPVAKNGLAGYVSTTNAIADGTAPVLLDIYAEAGDTVLTAFFSENTNENSLTNIDNWQIDNGLRVSKIYASNNGEGWTLRDSSTFPRTFASSCVCNNKIYVFGDLYELYFVEEYDTKSNVWTRKADMLTPRYYTSCVEFNNKIYVMGGNSNEVCLKTNEVYDPASNTWKKCADMPRDRYASAIVAYNNEIYVFGGYNSLGEASSTVDIYNPEKNTWRSITISKSQTPSSFILNGILDNNIFYLIGNSWNLQSKSIDIYNPENNEITESFFDYEYYTSGAGSVFYHKNILFIGGSKYIDMSYYSTNEVSQFNITSKEWSNFPSLPEKITDCNAQVVDNRIYVIGKGEHNNNCTYEYSPFDNPTIYLSSTIPTVNTPITVTVSGISDKYGNISGSQTITIFPDDGNKNPKVSIEETAGELNNDITFHYTISDVENDIVKIKAEYSIDGGNTWIKATVTGDSLNLDFTKYAGSLIWNSYTDLPGVEKTNIRFRITPRDADPRTWGTPGISNKLIIDNNLSPVVSITPIIGEVKNTVTVSYSVNDTEEDAISIQAEYMDNALKQWKLATVTGTTTNLSNGTYSLDWNTLADLPTGTEAVSFSITAYDVEAGKPDTIVLVLDNLGVCSIQITNTIVSETGGDIVFDYLISDDESDIINLSIQYSKDNGITWLTAAVTGTTMGITSANYSGSFVWNTMTNFNRTDVANVKWRAIPNDANPGIKAEGIIHIDNNERPQLVLQDKSGILRSDVVLAYSMTDPEGDLLSLQAKVEVGSNWIPCTLTGTRSGIAQAYYSGTITWNSATDIPDADGEYRVVFIPFDKDEGIADTITVFINNMSKIALGGDAQICADQGKTLSTGTNYSSYLWSTNATTKSIIVTDAGEYWVKTTDVNGKNHYSDTIVLTVNPLPVVDLGEDENICRGSSVTIDAGSFSSYIWNTSKNSRTITVTETGIYAVTVTDNKGCKQSDSKYVFVQAPNENEQICFVTANAQTNNNVIIWQPTAGLGTVSYSIFRKETNTDYVEIGTQNFAEAGVFVDELSFPDQLQYSYKISLADSCGHQSQLSSEHSTIYLKVNKGSAGFDLTWTAYQGIAVPKYEIYRGSDSTNLQKIYETAGSILTWSDVYSPECIVYYQIRVQVAGACKSAGGTEYSYIASNIASNGALLAKPVIIGPTEICSGTSTVLDAGNFESYIWSNGKTTQTITVTAGGDYKVTVTNMSGCIGVSAPFTLSINPAPQFDLGADTSICGSGSLTLKAPAGFVSYLWDNASTQASRTVTSNGLYAVTVTDGNGCTNSDEKLVTFHALPTISLPSIEYVCPGEIASLDPGEFESYVWSTSSESRIIQATTGSYSVTVTDINGCKKAAQISVSNYSNPSVSLGADVSVCSGDSYTFDAGNYSAYAWSNGKITQTISANATGNFSVKVTDVNGCQWRSDTVSLTVLNLPEINLGADTSICGSGSLTLKAPTGFVSYLWDNASLQANRTVTTNGLYAVTVTDGTGCTNSDEKLVTFHTLPTISLPSIEYVCPGEIASLDPGDFESYIWSTSSESRIIQAATGSYSVTVTDINGCKKAAQISVSNYSNPSVSLGADVSVCSGDSYTFDAGNYSAYAWSNGKITQTISANATGNYSVKVTDVNGCQWRSDTVSLTVLDLPEINLGADTSICGSGSLTIKAPSGFVSYLWDNASTQANRTVTSNGLYAVTVTDGNGCTNSDEKLVTFHALPTISLPSIEYVCPGEIASLDPGEFESYIWSTSSESRIIQAATGSYSVTVTDINGCKKAAQISVSNYSNPSVSLGADVSVCSGDSYTFDAGNYSAYAWSNGKITQTISANATGNYSVKVTDSNGCQWRSDTVSLTVLNLPEINLGADTSICGTSSLTLKAPEGFVSYLWDNASTQANRTVTTNGLYAVSVTDGNECTNSDEVLVSYQNLPVINLNTIEYICGNDIAYLDPGAYQNYLWSTGFTGRVLTTDSAGSYRVTVTDVHGCKNTADVLLQIRNQSIIDAVSLGNDTVICKNSTLELATQSQFSSYIWSDGSINETLLVSKPGTYSVIVKDIFNCSSTDNIKIIAATEPEPVELGEHITSCEKDHVTLNSGSGYKSYLWSSNAKTQSIQVQSSGLYKVTVSNEYGCKTSDSVYVTILKPFAEPLGILTYSKNENLPGNTVLVVWERTANKRTEKYEVWKETGALGDYVKIGTRFFNEESIYEDISADVRIKQFRYKLATIDSVCHDTAWSEPHRTLFVQNSINIENHANVNWKPYEGVDFNTYRIYRGTDIGTFVQVDSLTSDAYDWTDPDVYQTGWRYRVGMVLLDTIHSERIMLKTSSGPFSLAISNIAEAELTSLGSMDENQFQIFPNPVKDIVTISSENQSLLNVQLFDISGQFINEKEGANAVSFDMKNLKNGTYILKIKYENKEIMSIIEKK